MTKAELLDKLRAAERDPDSAPFAELVQQCILFGGLEKGDFSRAFGVSKSSVTRWCSGKNHPISVVLKHVYAKMHQMVQEKA